jgi:hypothetical protein
MSLKPIVKRAAIAAGGLLELTEQLGIDRSAPYHWTQIPQNHVREVHRLTGIPLHELRPDLYERASR